MKRVALAALITMSLGGCANILGPLMYGDAYPYRLTLVSDPSAPPELEWCRQFFTQKVTEQQCHDAQMRQAQIDRQNPPQQDWTVTRFKVMPRLDGSIEIIQQ